MLLSRAVNQVAKFYRTKYYLYGIMTGFTGNKIRLSYIAVHPFTAHIRIKSRVLQQTIYNTLL